MKKLFLLFTILVCISCSKDDDDQPTQAEEMEEEVAAMAVLPPATQTGAGTFGCLIDGEVFIEDNDAFNTLYAEVAGDFFFITGAFNPQGPVRQVRLGSEQASIEEGVTYDLGVGAAGGYYGEVLFIGNDTPTTTAMMAGTLTITKLDPTNTIVSGTFSFDVISPIGAIVEVREGRFDQIYMN